MFCLTSVTKLFLESRLFLLKSRLLNSFSRRSYISVFRYMVALETQGIRFVFGDVVWYEHKAPKEEKTQSLRLCNDYVFCKTIL